MKSWNQFLFENLDERSSVAHRRRPSMRRVSGIEKNAMRIEQTAKRKTRLTSGDEFSEWAEIQEDASQILRQTKFLQRELHGGRGESVNESSHHLTPEGAKKLRMIGRAVAEALRDRNGFYTLDGIIGSNIEGARNGLPQEWLARGRSESVSEARDVSQSDLIRLTANVTEAIGESYNSALGVKGALDTMHEIPQQLMQIYGRTGKVLSILAGAKSKAYQSQMEMRRMR